ncbi:MAG: helix-turn-helix domain-containing protein [Clostridia bacterium]|nr:helix-turn-helix domain-containing protein [Clostridia bacterium]
MSDPIAQDIVESMKEIINQDINYIDTNSMIIASTNKMRIGTFHGGAKRVLAIKSEVIIEYDEQYEGTRQGINLPVYFQSEIVGVIGITGKKEQVEKFGKIIQRMTAILIKEAYITEQEKIERESKKQFIEEILFRMYKEDEKTLIMRADLLNIKLDIPRVVIIARIYEDYVGELLVIPSIQEKIYNYIKSYIDFNSQNLIVQSGMNSIVILDVNSIKKVYRLVKNIHENIKEKFNITVCFGISSISENVGGMRKSYIEAKKALNVALSSRRSFIKKYQDLDIGLLLDDILDATKTNFVNKIFKNMDKDERSKSIEILIKYFENNGSINKTADELFLHKNTLQYRLNKIKKLTGYDPRVIEDMVVLYLAVILNRLEK